MQGGSSVAEFANSSSSFWSALLRGFLEFSSPELGVLAVCVREQRSGRFIPSLSTRGFHDPSRRGRPRRRSARKTTRQA